MIKISINNQDDYEIALDYIIDYLYSISVPYQCQNPMSKEYIKHMSYTDAESWQLYIISKAWDQIGILEISTEDKTHETFLLLKYPGISLWLKFIYSQNTRCRL